MKKGFTLIELLAVILILGIIALIAIPQVTNVIGSASKGAAETSAKHYVDAVTNKIALSKLDTNQENALKDGVYQTTEISVDVSGSTPESGIIVINDGEVKYANVNLNGYTVTCSSNGKCHAAQYVYFQQANTEFESFDQTVPEIPTEYRAYLRINKDDITDVQPCFFDNGKEFCLNPKSFEESRQMTLDYFGYNSSWNHYDTKPHVSYKADGDYIVECGMLEENAINCGDFIVGAFMNIYGQNVHDETVSPWFTCYVDANGYSGCEDWE